MKQTTTNKSTYVDKIGNPKLDDVRNWNQIIIEPDEIFGSITNKPLTK